MLDRYLAATPAMSLVPLAPFDFILVLFSFVYAAAVTHDENGHSGNIQRSTSNIQRRTQSRGAAIFINNRWVQSPSRTGGLALVIQIGCWNLVLCRIADGANRMIFLEE